MKKRKKIVLVSITILLIVMVSTTIVVYALDETIDLRPGPVQVEEQDLTYYYYVPFFDGDNTNKLASVYSGIDGEHNDQNWFRISIWHEENTHLDKLTLTFPNMISDRLLYRLPGGSWPPMEFGYTVDGKGTVVDIPEFGFTGGGTVNMRFLILNNTGDDLEELSCYVDMQLSEDKVLGAVNIKYNAETNLEMAVPGPYPE